MSDAGSGTGGEAWPFQEARKLLARVEARGDAKREVLLETGYGPSGLPHIGTFGEVQRTSMVRQAFRDIAPHIATRLIADRKSTRLNSSH